MPTVLRLRQWRVTIYPNDHRPRHVHILGPQQEARCELLCEAGRVQLMSNIGFSLRQLRWIAIPLMRHLEHLCSEWRRIHGD